ncbi:MAG: DUF2953 domain-containing protein [Oscillospiraceae bacterium]|nr:DUF2953 domain-containing protein [Oscillospiraceae bacterium]
MIALGIIVAALLIIALIRFGVSVEYSSEGIVAFARAGFLRFKLFPQDKKRVKKDKPEKKFGGSVSNFFEMVPPIRSTLSRIRRRLLIKKLTIHFTSAGEDASKTAMAYGAANAAIGMLTPILENNFRIRRRNFSVSSDFLEQQQSIYVNAAFSLAVWEAVYIVFALFPLIKILFKSKPVKKRWKGR